MSLKKAFLSSRALGPNSGINPISRARPGKLDPNGTLTPKLKVSPSAILAKEAMPPVSLRTKIGLALFGTCAFSITMFISNQYALEKIGKKKDGDGVQQKLIDGQGRQKDLSTVYDNIAEHYDSDVSMSEFLMGINFLRKKMARHARGHVLEVSAGTGRNSQWYELSQCRSITMVDSSEQMLRVAQKAFRQKFPKYYSYKFVVQDAAKPIEAPEGGFDSVIQSMGLCSHYSPIEVLQNLESSCKPGGRIFLLEHGRSHYDWLNRILDRYAGQHASEWGCWWNRDIEALVKESGLDIENITRYHFGTTYWIEARSRLK